jgi:large subunit ribosomal protein L6
MSKIGNVLIKLNGATVTLSNDIATVKGPLGTLNVNYPSKLLKININTDGIKVDMIDVNDKKTQVFHGTIASNIKNAIEGVTKGFVEELKIVGVGYKAAVSGQKITLSIGFSHPVVFEADKSIKVAVPEVTKIILTGYDKQKVSELAANIRSIRKPEPYKGKGIFRNNEKIIRKVGKTAEGSGKKK